MPRLPELSRALRLAVARAQEAGALHPIASRAHPIEDGGIHFSVRVAVRGAGTPFGSASGPTGPAGVAHEGDEQERRPGAPPARNPFLPYEPALFVADLSPTHVCILNKFPVLRDHALLVTRRFEEQEAPLTRADFEALWIGVIGIDGLGFYNAGPIAGASQRHRHLQLVPTPFGDTTRRTPLDAVLDEARFDERIGHTSALPFLHAVARLRDCADLAPREAAPVLHALYAEMTRAFGCDRPGRPYNLLATRDWMLLVPRARDGFDGIAINALGYAGALLVRSDDALARLRAVGPLRALAAAGVATGERGQR